MKKICLSFVLVFALVAVAGAQQKPAQPVPPTAQPPAQPSDDISGMYTFLREGEFVQVSVDEGVVSGFVSRYGDSDTSKSAFITQFFDKASLKDDKLTWITKTVHDTWYEFKGTVGPGPGKTPDDEGYRVLKGKLTIFKKDAAGKTTKTTREVLFKSFPADVQ